MSELLFEQTGQLGGAYPDIPLPADIDREALGPEAFFVTLPIGRVDAKSRNGRVYPQQAIEQLVNQINERRPEGGWGHLREEDRGTQYHPPAIRWLAAILQNGTAWAKGLPLTEQARQYFQFAKATGARVGTSIYGTYAPHGSAVAALDLERIDLADPTRVGVPETAAKPKITTEMEEGNSPMEPNEPLITELRTDRDAARTRVSELETQITTLRPLAEQTSAIQEVLAECASVLAAASLPLPAGAPAVEVIREMARALGTLAAERLQTQVDAVIREGVKVPGTTPQGKALGDYVRLALGKVNTAAEARAGVQRILETETYQVMAKALIVEMAGPAAVTETAQRPETGETWRDQVARDAAKIASEMGIVIQ